MRTLLLLMVVISCNGQRYRNTPSEFNYSLVNSMDSLTNVSGSSKLGSVFTITGANNVASRIQYGRNVTPAYCTMIAEFTPVSLSSSRLSFGLGRSDANYGSVIIVNDTGLVKIAKWAGGSSYNTPSFTYASGIDIVLGQPYTIELTKRGGYHDFTITHAGQTYSNTFFSYFTTAGSFFGAPNIICETGVVTVSRWAFQRPRTNPQFVVFGDSFVGDGGHLPYKKYVEFIKDSIGVENIYISGRGGETTSTFISTKMSTELSWFQGQKTVLIALGTNDNDFSTYNANMLAIIAAIKSKGASPILVTITPRSDFNNSAFIASANAWVRASGYKYVDIYNAVTTAGAWKVGYQDADGVHPTALGQQAMWEAVRAQIGTELKK